MAKLVTIDSVVLYLQPDDWEPNYSPEGYLTLANGIRVGDIVEDTPGLSFYSDVVGVPEDLQGGWYTFNGSDFMPTDQHPGIEDSQPAPEPEEGE